jgi:hypothetical protein
VTARIGPLTLAEHNRAVLAERTHWPVGALETCERLTAEHQGWMVWWMSANTCPGWERPAGYCATRGDHHLVGGDELWQDGTSQRLRVFAPEPAGLALKIAAMMERVAAKLDEDERMRQWLREGARIRRRD